jgi:hypothetical protein
MIERDDADLRLTEEESAWVGRAPGSSLPELLAGELGLLGNRWLDEEGKILLFERVCQTYLGRSRFLWTLDRKELNGVREHDDDAASG